MDGLTRAQIRSATVAALQADATLIAQIPADHILSADNTPLTEINGKTVIVWTERQRLDSAGGAMGFAEYATDTDVAVQLTCPDTTGASEAALDLCDLILTALLSSQTWMALWDGGRPQVDVEPFRLPDGDREWVGAVIRLTCRHLRGY